MKISVSLEDVQQAIKEMEKDGFLVAIRGDKMIVIGKPIKNTKEKVQFT
jgi:DNA-binding transcriptional regulator YhcF (GntR family)